MFQKVGKSQNKAAVAEEISCQNEIVLSKIGRGYELRQNKNNTEKSFKSLKKCSLDGWVSGWVEVKAVLRIAYSNHKIKFLTDLSSWMWICSSDSIHGMLTPSCHPMDKKFLERFSKLSWHAAVDAKVEGVGEADAEIDGQDDGLDGGVVEKVVDGWRDGVQDCDNAERQFHQQEYLEIRQNKKGRERLTERISGREKCW